MKYRQGTGAVLLPSLHGNRINYSDPSTFTSSTVSSIPSEFTREIRLSSGSIRISPYPKIFIVVLDRIFRLPALLQLCAALSIRPEHDPLDGNSRDHFRFVVVHDSSTFVEPWPSSLMI